MSRVHCIEIPADEANAKRLFVAAQRAWIAFRDAECGFSSSGVAQGSDYPMVATPCREELTRDRVNDSRGT
ncbi:MAG: lysozyme inhibitor LprI family protein [Methyloceanibacter sp.]